MGAQCLLRCSGGTGWGGVSSPCAPTPLTGAPISLGTHWEPGLDLAALHVSCLILVWRVCGPGFLPALTSEAPEAQRSCGSRTGPPSASLHQSPVTGCPGGRLSWAHPPDSAGLPMCPSAVLPCWLPAPSSRSYVSSHSPLPPCGPAGPHSTTWGCCSSG